MNTVTVIGHLGENGICSGGQGVKTTSIVTALTNRYGSNNISCFETYGKLRDAVKAPLYAFMALRQSKNVIILPAKNGLKIYAPLLVTLNIFFKRKIHYIVIGGWLPLLCQQHRWLGEIIKNMDFVYVETNTMKQKLNQQGLNNILIMPNFKELQVLEEPIEYADSCIRLCTFSRITEKKGIKEAVDAVASANRILGKNIFSLDIYGQVVENETNWFEELKRNFPDSVRYNGFVKFGESVEILKNYFALLFPTKFYTEGIPGTILDAYAAGIPVIASMWESFSDVIDEGVTGIGYAFNDQKALLDVLLEVAENPSLLLKMRKNCLIKAESYKTVSAMNILIKNL